ncbi:glycosyltransferase family 4 protein [Pseudomonadota bacterium]
MKKLTYITDLDRKPGGGGSYAVNWHIQQQLGKHFELHTPAPIFPVASFWEKSLSRLQRHLLHKPSRFFYFSPKTLDSNATRAAECFGENADAVFFRSATRWCHCRPEIPYFIYLDIVFHTFFENTFNPKDFLAADLGRIYQSEARFLEGASAVFFESKWGLRKAREAYSLAGEHYVVAGRGGALEPPLEDRWTGKPLIILSIAMNFEQKGGDIIFKAFEQLRIRHPDLRWHIVGGRPNGNWEAVDGIFYEGLLDPENSADLARYCHLLSQAFLLVHPTREDTNPLVLTEAAYFGCPTISVNRFAIPELVLDGKTGLLLDWPVNVNQLTDVIHRLIESPELYREMRKAAFEFSRSECSWNQIGNRMAGVIGGLLEQRGKH